MLDKIWKDPVWSKVIAQIITWGGGLISAAIIAYAHISSSSTAAWLNAYSLPNFATILILIFATLTYTILAHRKSKNTQTTAPTSATTAETAPTTLSSNEWFDAISDKLSDCTFARIYLRSFEHPDNFREEHRAALMKILEGIKVKLKNKADIKIISFNPTNEKSAVDWLKAELSGQMCTTAVKIFTDQPVANGSSMYLFDDKTIVFNRKNGKTTSYHVENYSNSIVHEMILRGFNDLQRSIP